MGKQSAAHTDLAMDAPDGQFNSFGVESLLPGKDVLVDAVDKRAVEIEEEGRFDTHGRRGSKTVLRSLSSCTAFAATLGKHEFRNRLLAIRSRENQNDGACSVARPYLPLARPRRENAAAMGSDPASRKISAPGSFRCRRIVKDPRAGGSDKLAEHAERGEPLDGPARFTP